MINNFEESNTYFLGNHTSWIHLSFPAFGIYRSYHTPIISSSVNRIVVGLKAFFFGSFGAAFVTTRPSSKEMIAFILPRTKVSWYVVLKVNTDYNTVIIVWLIYSLAIDSVGMYNSFKYIYFTN